MPMTLLDTDLHPDCPRRDCRAGRPCPDCEWGPCDCERCKAARRRLKPAPDCKCIGCTLARRALAEHGRER